MSYYHRRRNKAAKAAVKPQPGSGSGASPDAPKPPPRKSIMPPIRPIAETGPPGVPRSSKRRREAMHRNERFITWTIFAAIALAIVIASLGEGALLWRQYGGVPRGLFGR